MTKAFTYFKKSIAVLAMLCMILAAIPLKASALTVSDISRHWAQATIQKLANEGIITGYPDGSFKPDDSISRVEFMTMANRAFGYTATVPIAFPDVKIGAWYYNIVAVGFAAGYISGLSDGTMRPENPITRQEAATIIMRMVNLTQNEAAANSYFDAGSFSWGKGAIGAVLIANIMVGYPNGNFGTQDYLKRASAAVCIDRARNYAAGLITPLAPMVTGNDETNKVSGMTTMMAYNLDGTGWFIYDEVVFNALNLSGNHSLLVRYAAKGIIPFGLSRELLFTTNGGVAGDVDKPGDGGGVVIVDVSAITVTGASDGTAVKKGDTLQMSAAVTPTNATYKTVTWSVAPTSGSGAGSATINASTGLLTGTGNGTVLVTATANNNIKGYKTITILDINWPYDVAPEDFGVMNVSGVTGYNVGFHLVDATYADVSNVTVKLYNGATVLASNTATAKFFMDLAAVTIASSPFDVIGNFDYVSDGYWTNSGWSGLTSTIPDKAEITVTFKNGLVMTATNTLLTGDTSIFTKGDVAPEDFSVMNVSGVTGYNVGFHLVDATYANVSNVTVKLYNGATVLASNTATAKFFTDFAGGTIQSSPFDVLGSFDYVSDGYWTNSGWSGLTSTIPDKAEITVTFKNGLVMTATNTLLTGDTSIFTKGDVAPEDFSVMNVSGVTGYNVGFHLVDATYANVSNVTVKLYNGATVLASNTATAKFLTDFAAGTIQSSPFDVLGSFDYVSDGYWTNSGWSGLTSIIPDKAEITVTFKNGLVMTATNALLTGDTSIFTISPITGNVTNLTATSVTLNGTTSDVAATTSFWYGVTMPTAAFVASATPGTQLPDGTWKYTPSSVSIAAHTVFGVDVSGLTPGTTYYYVAWTYDGTTWYPGVIKTFTT